MRGGIDCSVLRIGERARHRVQKEGGTRSLTLKSLMFALKARSNDRTRPSIQGTGFQGLQE